MKEIQAMRFWVNTVSRAHVQVGIAGGFMQADHGHDARLKRLAKGDRVVFYSAREENRAGETVQRFTAVAEVLDDEPFQTELTADFHPSRRRVKFLDCTETPIQPLIEHLEFIPNKKSWGFPFRRGFFEINESDFQTIVSAMTAEKVA